MSIKLEKVVEKFYQNLEEGKITDHTLRAQRRQQIDKYVKDYINICAEGEEALCFGVMLLDVVDGGER